MKKFFVNHLMIFLKVLPTIFIGVVLFFDVKRDYLNGVVSVGVGLIGLSCLLIGIGIGFLIDELLHTQKTHKKKPMRMADKIESLEEDNGKMKKQIIITKKSLPFIVTAVIAALLLVVNFLERFKLFMPSDLVDSILGYTSCVVFLIIIVKLIQFIF